MQNNSTSTSKQGLNNAPRCELCNKNLPNQSSFMQHISGQKHKKMLQSRNEQRSAEQKCGIFIKGYPSNWKHDDILKYFSNFGTTVSSNFCRNFLLLDYSDPRSVQKVIKTSHTLGGRKLIIKLRKRQTKKPFKQSDASSSAMEELKNMKSMLEQISAITYNLQEPNSVHMPKYNQICNDLYNVLRYSYPVYSIYPFGSTVTGLCFYTSDIDIYVSGIRKTGEKDTDHLHRIKRIMKNSNCFSNIVVIGHAKIPILKCVHLPTKTNCDINIRNKLGVCNSKLISYYLNFDVKIKQMLLIIKYWSMVHKITGQTHLFTNYSLCMMVLFFLQGPPYHLPSVKYLQEDKKYFNIQDVWNGGFKEIHTNCQVLKHTSLLDLLANFFSYYADFDYGTYIICPYTGKLVKKSDFDNPDSLPDHYDTYKKVIKMSDRIPLKVTTSICVQDPFEHTRNVTPAVSISTINIFVGYCKYAKTLAKDGEHGYLYKLFYQTPPDMQIEKITSNQLIHFGVLMGSQFKYLSNKVDENVANRSQVIKELWFDSVKKFTQIVLRDFLNMKIEEDCVSSSKKQKTEGQTDVYTNLGLVLARYKCVGRLNMWHTRSLLQKHIEPDERNKGVIQRETYFSQQIIEKIKFLDHVTNTVVFDVVLEKKIEPAQVVFVFTNTNSYKNMFKSFGDFFVKQFPMWFATYEKEMNQNC